MENVIYKRKIHVVNKKLQYRLIAFVLFMILFSLVVFTGGLLLYYWVEYMYGDNLFKEVITIHKQVTEVRVVEENGVKKTVRVTTTRDIPGVNRLEIILPPLLINNLVIMVLLAIFGIYYTNRIAGPVYRMEKDIEKMLRGERGVRVRLRKGDHFTSLSEKLNILLDEFEKTKNG